MFDVKIYGASRSKEIGIIVNNFPSGLEFDIAKVQNFVSRRSAGKNPWSTPRQERDEIKLISGAKPIGDGIYRTDGNVLEFKIENNDIKKDNITELEEPICRPSHADYVSYIKFGAVYPGGGSFSGRMMAPFAILGGIAIDILNRKGISINAYISQIAEEKSISYKDDNFSIDKLIFNTDTFKVISIDEQRLTDRVMKAKHEGDSVGGIIECISSGIPAGLGDNLNKSFESLLSHYLFTIPAIKAVEFGLGFDFALKQGSEVNDQFKIENKKVKTISNNNGGINGGITNGMPILFRVAIKPTPSISKEQKALKILKNGKFEVVDFSLKGRNDACIVPRAVVLVESAMAIALLEEILLEEEI